MANTSSPLVSVILLAYNQENLITEAVESLLAQTYSQIEFIFSDDASTDNTYAVIAKLVEEYKGNHVIKLNQNKVNLGIGSHVNAALALTQGELVFAAAGDDVSLPNRCSKVVLAWLEQNRNVDLIATDTYDMSFNGDILGVKRTDKLENWRNIEDWFSHHPFIIGASHTWSRKLINRYGILGPKIRAEDQVMTFRAILTGSAINIPEPLVKHRRGGVSEKTKYASVYIKRQEIVAGNNGSIEFTQQCIKDAKVLGQEELVTAGFKSTIEQDQVIQQIFNSNSIIEKIKITFSAKQIKFGKKIRFLIYAAFPWLMMPYFFIKTQLIKLGN